MEYIFSTTFLWTVFFAETHQQIIPPDFTKNLKSVDALEGSPFAFECHVMGIPSPTISWFKDEISIDSSPDYVITKINGTCCLKIKRVTREHSARYTCRANNPGGEAASSARLTVIRKFPWLQTISMGMKTKVWQPNSLVDTLLDTV